MVAPPWKTLFDFTGKTALITGAGQGLGAGIARRFAEAGAAVAVHYHTSAQSAEALCAEIKAAEGRAAPFQADLKDGDAAGRLVAAAVAHFGGLDVLINNAGAYPLHNLLAMTAADWEAVMAANLTSAFLCTQAAARHMMTRGGGAVINITSIEAESPAPDHSHYVAAKAGLNMLTQAAAAELGRQGVRVNAVAPGLIWREGLDEAWPEGVRRYTAAAPLGRLGQPEDVADACLFLASPAARWITGAVLRVDGGVLTNRTY